jgi:hypothetical protein
MVLVLVRLLCLNILPIFILRTVSSQFVMVAWPMVMVQVMFPNISSLQPA